MLMNINQMAVGLTAGRSHGSALVVIGVSRDTPTVPVFQTNLSTYILTFTVDWAL